MQSTMMNYPLTLAPILERAGRLFGASEIVSRLPDKSLAAHAIVAETLARQASLDRVFMQLRELETGLLRLWMLLRQQESRL